MLRFFQNKYINNQCCDSLITVLTLSWLIPFSFFFQWKTFFRIYLIRFLFSFTQNNRIFRTENEQKKSWQNEIGQNVDFSKVLCRDNTFHINAQLFSLLSYFKIKTIWRMLSFPFLSLIIRGNLSHCLQRIL